MKPISLILSGWGPYQGNEEVDFTKLRQNGLFLIAGPTGSGKTTIFDGITYALYGEVSGSIREKDSLRSDFAKPETATGVILTFTHGGKEYRVIRNPRYERPKLRGEGYTTEGEAGELYEENHLLISGSAKVTQRIKELLGLDYQQFKQISMIAQGEFQQLLVASSKERTQIFRDIFQTKLYDTMAKILAIQVKQIVAKVDEKKYRAEEITASFQIEHPDWKELLDKKNRNYGKLIELVEQELHQGKEATRHLGELLEVQEREYKITLQQVEQVKQQNLMIAQYERDCIRLEELKSEKERLLLENSQLKNECGKLPAMQDKLAKDQDQVRRLREREKSLEQWLGYARKLKEKQKEYLELDGFAMEKKGEYECQDDRYRKASAGILARDLKTGIPCPVCGSAHHPLPAKTCQDLPDEQHLKSLKQSYEKAWQKAVGAQNQAATLLGTLQSLESQLEDKSLTRAGEQGLWQIKEEIRETELGIRRLEEDIRRLTERYQSSQLKLEKTKSAYEQMKSGVKPPKELKQRDITELSDFLMHIEGEKRRLLRLKEQSYGRFTNNQKSLGILKEHIREKEKLEQEYGTVREIERAAGGCNHWNLVFEQYVLSVYFDDILCAANQRLLMMTGDRYELYRLPQSKDRRMKEGMELEVLDQYTGKKRSVRSLSGGELFKAALALALGTSDVVQSYAGGIQVETLFVDEGFGSLDAESLNQAIGILTVLSGGNRMIGIISHVEDLKEQIDNQILIEKTAQGSRITMEY